MGVRGEFVVLGLAGILLAGVGALAVQANSGRRALHGEQPSAATEQQASPLDQPPAASATEPRDVVVTGTRTLLELDRTPLRTIALAAPQRDAGEVRRALALHGGATYIGDMLVEDDSLLSRWPDRTLTALRVWVQPHADIPGWNDRYPQVVRDVFPEWSRAGFPIRFLHVVDSASADLHIRFTASLPGLRIGLTNRYRDQHGWIVAAEVLVATASGTGEPLPADLVAGIARHEVGHALGLGHASDPATVMFPESRTVSISPADRATLHLLYMLPPGSVR